jgi:Uma2 family endonuclease
MEVSIDLSKRYTYADYIGWLDGIRRELIDGIVKLMGSPRRFHQKVYLTLGMKLYGLIKRHRGFCEVYLGFDVRLPEGNSTEDNKITTVVCPDIIVVCDVSKLSDDRCCTGAPDLVIEIQSPSTSHYDMDTKLHLYERHGVREYWVVDPIKRWVRVFTPGVDGLYGTGVLYASGFVPVSIFGGELISISDIFDY